MSRFKTLLHPLAAAWALAACAAPSAPTAPVAPDMHNARISLDWAGTYQGTLPGASCSGIRTELTLRDNGSYDLRETYLGNPQTAFEGRGTFSWNPAGDTVTLYRDGRSYFVGENHLIALDADGRRVKGALAEAYILQKTH